MNIAENIANVVDRIARAEKKAARPAGSVKLVAVSKNHTADEIVTAFESGQTIFGENYAQEFRDKVKQLESQITSHKSQVTNHAIEWHFLGHMQKNKVKYVVPAATWIHSVDSIELLETIVARLKNLPATEPATINCLIEVSIAGEEAKSGISLEKLPELVRAFSTYALTNSHAHALNLCGLMCMPPFSDDAESSRPYFRKLAAILNDINSKGIYPTPLTELSMGMSNDFEVAIEEGATIVRVGTLIFGERSYK